MKQKKLIRFLWLAALLALLSACGVIDDIKNTITGGVEVTLNPTSVALAPGETQDFTVTVKGTDDASVTWSTTGGVISGDGDTVTYKAPQDGGHYVVTVASRKDPGKTATATVEVSAAAPGTVTVRLNPTGVTLAPGDTQDFTATVTGSGDTAVTWSVTGGTLDGEGKTVIYTAPADVGSYTLTAKSKADPGKKATATITVEAQETEPGPGPVSLSPKSAALIPGETQTFKATVTGTTNKGVTWTADGGTVEGSGNTITYHAPEQSGSYTLTAASKADSSKRATATIEVGDGRLEVDITGLPSGVEANVAVTNHKGYSQWVWKDRMLAASPGSYSVVAASVIAGGTVYLPEKPVQNLSFTADTPARVTVKYSQGTGKIYATTPDFSTCTAGMLTQEAKDRALYRLNFVRALVGVPSVPYDLSSDDIVQQAALIVVNNTENLDRHHPPKDSVCYSEEGYKGANTSNLYYVLSSRLETVRSYFPETSVNWWFADPPEITLGHRRWAVDPFLPKTAFGMSYGSVQPGKYADPKYPYGAGSALHVVLNQDAGIADLKLAFVAYPKGDFPAELLDEDFKYLSFSVLADPADRWNNDKSTVNYSEARVRVADAAGTALSVSNLSYNYDGYGTPNHLQWELRDLKPNVNYTVTVSDVRVKGKLRSYSYTFKLR